MRVSKIDSADSLVSVLRHFLTDDIEENSVVVIGSGSAQIERIPERCDVSFSANGALATDLARQSSKKIWVVSQPLLNVGLRTSSPFRRMTPAAKRKAAKIQGLHCDVAVAITNDSAQSVATSLSRLGVIVPHVFVISRKVSFQVLVKRAGICWALILPVHPFSARPLLGWVARFFLKRPSTYDRSIPSQLKPSTGISSLAIAELIYPPNIVAVSGLTALEKLFDHESHGTRARYHVRTHDYPQEWENREGHWLIDQMIFLSLSRKRANRAP